MEENFRKKLGILTITAALTVTAAGCGSMIFAKDREITDTEGNGKITITNVSYDPTREFYEAYNGLFENYYKETYGVDVDVVQSHGGSGSQARSVVEGAEADVVTLALAHDVSLLGQFGMIDDGWEEELPDASAPYTSTIVFLVREGNEKQIADWDDLVKPGVDVITPDPKSSGGAGWNFLAAWNYAIKTYGGDEAKAKEFVKQLYENVTVMDSGSRGSTTTFVENGQGDVLIAWENEALQTMKEYPGSYEIVYPDTSILAQPSVAVVDENARKDGTEEISRDYLSYLYSDEAQELIAENGFRPVNEEILSEHADEFPQDMELCTIDDFGGWDVAYAKFFADDGIFDEIYLGGE